MSRMTLVLFEDKEGEATELKQRGLKAMGFGSIVEDEWKLALQLVENALVVCSVDKRRVRR